MSKSMPVGTCPTPYGVSVPVFGSGEAGTTDPDAARIDFDGAMTIAGIHDPASRARCAAALKARMGDAKVYFSLFEKFGGHTVPRVALSPISPQDSFYNNMPKEIGIRDVCDPWIATVTDHPQWCDRALHLQEMLEGHVERWNGHMPHAAIALALSGMLTAVLENLGEQDIECLEAAGFYALSGHEPWRRTALDWLQPFRRTWWADWIKARPGYRRFARMTLKIHHDAPSWLAGSVR
jgi:hypothetical protein